MKNLNMLKKWVLISMLFVGISLTVYAVIPSVAIKSITLEEVTATTAKISVQHKGAEILQWGISIVGNDGLNYSDFVTDMTGPDDKGYYCSTFTITGLAPGTKYRVVVIVYEDKDDLENCYTQEGSINFTTLLEDLSN